MGEILLAFKVKASDLLLGRSAALHADYGSSGIAAAAITQRRGDRADRSPSVMLKRRVPLPRQHVLLGTPTMTLHASGDLELHCTINVPSGNAVQGGQGFSEAANQAYSLRFVTV